MRFAPEVFDFPGDRGVSGSSEDRFRLFDAVARLLSDITASAPWVVLDDVHRADYGSLLLLHHVVRMLAREQLLVMVNHRDTEPVPDLLVTGLAREPISRWIDLRGLAVPAVGKQLAALVGHHVAPAQVKRVHEVTGGNPFSSVRWAGPWPPRAQPCRWSRSHRACGATISYALGIMVAAAMDVAGNVAALRGLLSRYRGHHAAGGAGAAIR